MGIHPAQWFLATLVTGLGSTPASNNRCVSILQTWGAQLRSWAQAVHPHKVVGFTANTFLHIPENIPGAGACSVTWQASLQGLCAASCWKCWNSEDNSHLLNQKQFPVFLVSSEMWLLPDTPPESFPVWELPWPRSLNGSVEEFKHTALLMLVGTLWSLLWGVCTCVSS